MSAVAQLAPPAGRLLAALAAAVAAAAAVGCGSASPGGEPATTAERNAAAQEQQAAEPRFASVPGITTAREFTSLGAAGLSRWRRDAPYVRAVRIGSSADASRQPALWLPSSGEGDQPLLVVLHSWSSPYTQHIGIPFARWARRQGWAMIAPDFRGINDNRRATGSDRAVGDVVDAVDYAIDQGGVDRDRVFLIGFSGGGMMSLLAASRHAGRFAGAVSWVPIYDLVDWYGHHARQDPRPRYVEQITQSCGGNPHTEPAAWRSCRHRSPSRHLDRAREAGVPIYIGHGLDDRFVLPDHALRAFNQLADPGDRIGSRAVRRLADNTMPDYLRGRVEAPTHFDAGEPEVLFARRSGPATLVIFDGEHDMVFHPGLRWMVRLAAQEPGG